MLLEIPGLYLGDALQLLSANYFARELTVAWCLVPKQCQALKIIPLLAAMDNKCVVHAMFDCGRLRMTDGLEGWREEKDEEDKQWKEWKDKNTNYNGGCNILIFRSTGPCDQANAKSYLSKKFFDTIKKKCMMNGGRPVKSIDI